MSDMLLVLLIISAVILGWAIYETRRFARLSDENGNENDFSQESLDSLGASAAATMTARVESIMRRHRGDRCVAVALTEGAEQGPACAELHHLLPGDPVWLRASETQPGHVEVYSAGYKVGTITGEDAETALAVMNGGEVTGSYVCQQDCYEYYERVSVRFILFHQPEGAEAAVPASAVLDGNAHDVLSRGASAFVEEIAADPALLTAAPYRLASGAGTMPGRGYQN